MVSLFTWFNKENQNPNIASKPLNSPHISNEKSKINRNIIDTISMAFSGDELDSMKFYDRFKEESASNGMVVVAEKYNNTLKFNKKQLNEIVKLAKNYLKNSPSDNVSFRYGENTIDVRAIQTQDEIYLKMYLRSEEIIAGGGGGMINASTKLSSGSASVEKIGMDVEAFENEVEVLHETHQRIQEHIDDLRPKFPHAFRKKKSGEYACIVVSPNPSFVNLEEHRYHMKRFKGDLANHIERHGDSLTIKEKNKLAKDTIAAIAILHEMGVVHKDIKMPNFLVDQGGRVLIADFGEARVLKDTINDPNLPDLINIQHTFGTAEYTSVNIIKQLQKCVKKNDWEAYNYNLTRLDNYALGVVLYELYTGEEPYERDIRQSSVYRLGDSKVVAKPLKEGIFESANFKNSTPPDMQIQIQALMLGYPVDKQELYDLVPK
ncbi:MAG: protein kinase [Parachlamydiales bacterium]|jgi:tRNA A-37 threonylcarbamoyl transferase component Bud32